MTQQYAVQSSTRGDTLADILERVLDKGVMIAGDIKISLVDIELLTIQIRLVVCSVDKAKEMGMDWWVNNPVFSSKAHNEQLTGSMDKVEKRLARLEASLGEKDCPPIKKEN